MTDLSKTICVVTGNSNFENESNVDDNMNDDDDGTCELCEREIRRTFHHLIPKSTHSKYLKKKTLPENLKMVAKSIGVEACVSKAWFNSYGAMVCRACHSALHLAASNSELAENYNTVSLLLENPKIYSFVKYNSKQPVRQRLQA